MPLILQLVCTQQAIVERGHMPHVGDGAMHGLPIDLSIHPNGSYPGPLSSLVDGYLHKHGGGIGDIIKEHTSQWCHVMGGPSIKDPSV